MKWSTYVLTSVGGGDLLMNDSAISHLTLSLSLIFFLLIYFVFGNVVWRRRKKNIIGDLDIDNDLDREKKERKKERREKIFSYSRIDLFNQISSVFSYIWYQHRHRNKKLVWKCFIVIWYDDITTTTTTVIIINGDKKKTENQNQTKQQNKKKNY